MHDTTLSTSSRMVAVKMDSSLFGNDPVVRLRSAFQELDEEHRIVLSLLFVEKLNLAEIALVLDDVEENVHVVYAEAIAQLRGRDDRHRDAA